MLITNFASGELSETLNGRVDLQQYYSGAARLSNFEIIPTGGIKRRRGTVRCAQLAGECRLIPFIIDKNESFVLALKAGQATIYKSGAIYAAQNTFTIPYANLTEIKEIQYVQDYDRLVLVHKSYKPQIIKYDSSLHTFSCSAMDFMFYPDVYLDDDFDYIMLPYNAEPSRVSTADNHLKFTYNVQIDGQTVTKTKEYAKEENAYYILNGTLFEYEYGGNSWHNYNNDSNIDTTLFGEAGKYPGCAAFYNSRLFFASTDLGRQTIWASAAPNAKGTRYNNFSTFRKYVTVNQVTKPADAHGFTCSISLEDIDTVNNTTVLRNVSQDFTAGLSKPETDYYLTLASYFPLGTKVTAVTSNTITVNAAAQTTEDLTGIVGTLSLWKNAEQADAGDYTYTIVSQNTVTADCAFNFDIASRENEAIKWLGTGKMLAAGTESGVWGIPGTVTALNVQAEQTGTYGSDDIQAISLETALIYFAQGNKAIREYYYDSTSEAFRTNNLAILAPQMLEESRAVDFDFITNPINRIVVTRADGKAVTLLYDKNNGVMGWNRVELASGNILSIAVVRGNDENDIIYFEVKDGENYWLEELDPGLGPYIDGAKIYEGSTDGYGNTAILFNVTADKECSILDIPEDFITAGDNVLIGYKYESLIKSMPVIKNEANRQKRIAKLLVRFLHSDLPLLKYGSSFVENFIRQEYPAEGIKEVNIPSISEYDAVFTLSYNGTKEVEILAVEALIA